MSTKDKGFTLVEIMVVVVILAILSAVAIPNLLTSVQNARANADIATGHQLKTALDRYYFENGSYPTLTANGGSITSGGFIPEYISPLNSEVTQQQAAAEARGFGVATFAEDGSLPELSGEERLIMVYQGDSKAEVRVLNLDQDILWSSAE